MVSGTRRVVGASRRAESRIILLCHFVPLCDGRRKVISCIVRWLKGGGGEQAINVERDGGVDGDGVNRLNTPVGETLKRRGKKKKEETRESDDKL